MENLMRASEQLFTRRPDERYPSLDALWRHCHDQKLASSEFKFHPAAFTPTVSDETLAFQIGDEPPRTLNAWSFEQLCRRARVDPYTVNRLSAATAAAVFEETLRRDRKPTQAYAEGERLRSIHGPRYTRLLNAELLSMVQEFAVDFHPPQEGFNGATGLYCGEQDLFCFLIDPTGWVEIDGEAFAPGFFVWNSEVGRRSLGIQSFWFQAVCQNHIVWDAVKVTEYTRIHVTGIDRGLNAIREQIARLAKMRDSRRDSFATVIKNAMREQLGDEDEVTRFLKNRRLPAAIIREAMDIAKEHGRFTVFAIIDALTRVAGQQPNAGDRAEIDTQAGRIVSLAQ